MALEEYIKRAEGKHFVIGIDKFDYEDFWHGNYDDAKTALEEATKCTKEAMPLASDSSIATVYYAYTPEGAYLGGDVWNKK